MENDGLLSMIRDDMIERCGHLGYTKKDFDFCFNSNITFEDILICDALLGRNVDLTTVKQALKKYAWMNDDQKSIFSNAIATGLNKKQSRMFAKKEFSWQQMEQIYLGFLDGLTDSEVNLYAKPKYSYELMSSLRKGLIYGFRQKQLVNFAKDDINVNCLNINEEPIFQYAKYENKWN